MKVATGYGAESQRRQAGRRWLSATVSYPSTTQSETSRRSSGFRPTYRERHMVRLTRPGPELVERYRRSRERMAPTFERTDQLPSGFGQDRATVELTAPRDAFARARAALQTWAIQRDAGVEVTPPDAPVVPETTVAIVTRQLGLWFLAACRITEVIDTVREFGFTYATLPGHPERGEETFLVTRANPMAGAPARFEVAAIWRPDAMLPRLGGPLTAAVQRRATQRYLDAMVRWCATG